MIKKLSLLLFVAVFLGVTISIALPKHSVAATHSELINDLIFDNTASMSSSDIDAFLNNIPNSCLSQNSGFAAPDPIGYNPSQGYLYGGNVSAGTVIAHAAQAYDINPQVLLTTLQKEQSLVTGGGGCSDNAMAAAVGYGCPDSGGGYNYSGVNLFSRNGVTHTAVNYTCVNDIKKVGFTQQVIRGAWLLKFTEQRSEGNVGWGVVRGNWNNSDDPQTCYSGPMTEGYRMRCPNGTNTYYDGYTNIDGASTYIANGGTAALYYYTPHFSGNDHFVSIFEGWFGTTNAFYATNNSNVAVYRDSSESQPIAVGGMTAGDRAWIVMKFRNNGNAIWKQSGYAAVHLATLAAGNSPFCDQGWLTCSRPAAMQETSVGPGGTATFKFWYKAPNVGSTTPFSTQFGLIAEMLTNVVGDTPTIPTNVNPLTYMANDNTMASYADNSESQPVLSNVIPADTRIWVVLRFKNNGTATWSNSGVGAVRLATLNNEASSFCDNTWISCSRPTGLIENTVAPGSYGTFKFWYRAPGVFTDTTLFGKLAPVAELVSSITGDQRTMYTTAQAPRFVSNDNTLATYTDNSEVTPIQSSSISGGNRVWTVLRFRNDSTVTWYNGGQNPIRLALMSNTPSSFKDPSWISDFRVAGMQETSVAPGSYGTFKFWYKAPNVSRSTANQTTFGLVAELRATMAGQQRTMYTVVNP